MAKQEPGRVPDGIRSSASGRVPQWVLDEAAGVPVTPVPFRGPTSGSPADRPPRRRRSWAGLATGLVLALAGAVYAVSALDLAGVPITSDPASAQADRTWPTPGREEAATPLGTPPPAAELEQGTAFRFVRHQDDAVAPVTWSPCRPVEFVTRPDNAVVGGAALLAESAQRLAALTGLSIVDRGLTTEAPSEDRDPYQPQRYGDRWAPVLIAWATPAEVPDFGIDIAGEAGPTSVRTRSGDETYVSGVLYLDPVKIDQIRVAAGEDTARSIVLHEFGHLLGLAHVDDERSIMYPRGSVEVTDFSEGDRAGLAALGRGACQPDV